MTLITTIMNLINTHIKTTVITVTNAHINTTQTIYITLKSLITQLSSLILIPYPFTDIQSGGNGGRKAPHTPTSPDTAARGAEAGGRV